MRKDSGTNREEVFRSGATPAHTGATEARLKLFGATFNHATADRPLLFAHFEIVHAQMVALEIGGFSGKGFWVSGRILGGGEQLVGDNVGMALIKQGFVLMEPTAIA